MEIQKKQETGLRLFKQPEWLNRDLINHYVRSVGTPMCRCCGDITFNCFFRETRNGWQPFCINCAITRQAVGVCLHGNIKIVVIRVKE